MNQSTTPEKPTYKILFVGKDGESYFEEGVINDYPALEILKKHASEYGEPRVVYFNGKLTNL